MEFLSATPFIFLCIWSQEKEIQKTNKKKKKIQKYEKADWKPKRVVYGKEEQK